MKVFFCIPIFCAVQTVLATASCLNIVGAPSRKARPFVTISHNGAQSKAYGWLYAQQLGTIADQFHAGSRGDKLNLHWINPASYTLRDSLRCIKSYYVSHWFYRALITTVELALTIESFCSQLIFHTRQCLHTLSARLSNVSNGIKPPASLQHEVQNYAPYIGVCHERCGAANGALSYFQLLGRQPMQLQQYFHEWATLLETHPDDTIMLFLESHLDQRSCDNGALQINNTQIQQMIDQALEHSGLASFCFKWDATHDKTALLPTTKELQMAGKQAIIFIDRWHPEFKQSPYLNHELIHRTHWQFHYGSLYADMAHGVCRLKDPEGWQQTNRASIFRIDHGPENTVAFDLFHTCPLLLPIRCIAPRLSFPGNYHFYNSQPIVTKRLQHAQNAADLHTDTAHTAPHSTLVMCDFIELSKETKGAK